MVILFDLDGTLLPMDQDQFTKAYFEALSKKLAPYGYDPQQLIRAVWQGTKAMVENDGKQTSEQVFWKEFAKLFGDKAYLVISLCYFRMRNPQGILKSVLDIPLGGIDLHNDEVRRLFHIFQRILR